MTNGLMIRNLDKFYGDFQALKDINFEIPEGKFATLLGPSGCGKTTLLRIIAGFMDCDGGDIFFGDRRMNDVPPHKRDTAMCFQSYALFPHKTVYENIQFGLRMRKVPKEEQRSRIEEAMEIVNLTGLGERKPYELSGGQQQRVALARCIVVRPRLLLFDEPLSNLDAKLREKVRVEIRNIQQRLGITTVYVTHDQAEALAISDRILVMQGGRIVQNAGPREIYERPNSRFVADFIGGANLVPCTVLEKKGTRYLVESEYGPLYVEDPGTALDLDARGSLCIRPEDLYLPEQGLEQNNLIRATIKNAVYMGNGMDLFADVNGTTMRASISKNYRVQEGTMTVFRVAPERIRLLGE